LRSYPCSFASSLNTCQIIERRCSVRQGCLVFPTRLPLLVWCILPKSHCLTLARIAWSLLSRAQFGSNTKLCVDQQRMPQMHHRLWGAGAQPQKQLGSSFTDLDAAAEILRHHSKFSLRYSVVGTVGRCEDVDQTFWSAYASHESLLNNDRMAAPRGPLPLWRRSHCSHVTPVQTCLRHLKHQVR